MANEIQAAINRQVAEGVNAIVRVQTSKVLNQAAAHVGGQAGQQLAVFAAAFNSAVRRSRSGRIQRIHRDAAIRAQSAIHSAYVNRNVRNPSSSYRENAPGKWKRDSNGAMERGLKSPEFFRATGTQLEFINKNAMDRAARQWYRLNFGAGPAGAATPQPGAFPMRILGRDSGILLSLRGNAPSKGFMIPAGIWLQNAGGSEFVPYGYMREVGRTVGARGKRRTASKKRMSIGFPGYNYLDAGIDDLAIGLGAGYTQLAAEWFREATAKNTGPVAFVISQKEASGMLPSIERNIDKLARAGTLGRFSRRAPFGYR